MFGSPGSSPRRSEGISGRCLRCRSSPLRKPKRSSLRTLVRCRTSEANARSVARGARRRRGGRPQGPRPFASADLRGAGEEWARSTASPNRCCRGRGRPSIAVDAAHGFAFPALDAALAALPEVRAIAGHRRGADPALASLRRRRTCRSSASPRRGSSRSSSPTRRRRSRPGAARQGRVRHEPDRLCLPAARGGRRSSSIFPSRRSRAATSWPQSSAANGSPMAGPSTRPGRPTSDPEAALKGTMLPLGDAKGTALALMVELLAAGLTGASYAADASSFLDDEGRPARDRPADRRPRSGGFRGCGRGRPVRRLGRRMIEAQAGARLPGAPPPRLAGEGAAGGLADRRRAAARDREPLSAGVTPRFPPPRSAAPGPPPA